MVSSRADIEDGRNPPKRTLVSHYGRLALASASEQTRCVVECIAIRLLAPVLEVRPMTDGRARASLRRRLRAGAAIGGEVAEGDASRRAAVREAWAVKVLGKPTNQSRVISQRRRGG